MTLWEETLLTGFNRRPETWGAVVQTIQRDSDHFTCMATFSHWIVVAWSGGFMGIYDVVTGAMRLSLGPIGPIEAMAGSPDGSVLFCAQREGLITLWDIQTGGLIHSFVVEQARDIAVSSEGRYLFCLFSNESGKVWEVVREVVNKMEDAAVWDHSLVDCFCWLEPEEQLVITRGALVEIWGVVAGTILRSFTTEGYISNVVYSPELNRLATSSSFGDAIAIIDPQTGISSVLRGLPANLSSFSFSPTTEEIVYGMHGGGLEAFSLSTRLWRHFEYPRTPHFVFSVSNGTIVVGSMYYNIQLLSLDDSHAPSSPLALGLAVSALDQGGIIMITPAVKNQAHLLETSTLVKFLTISGPGMRNSSLTSAISTSLENRMTVYCLQHTGGGTSLCLFRFGDERAEWVSSVDSVPSAIAISPGGTRVVTSHGYTRGRIYMWDARNGQIQAELLVVHSRLLSDITFCSETRFYSHHINYRVPYDLNFSPRAPITCTIIRHEQQPWAVESSERKYQVDSSREWVIWGLESICWIPPGYLSSNRNSYCWAGSNTLVMIGEDGVVRTLTFRS